jgi:hypothetical protein
MILKLPMASDEILPSGPCETYLCILKQSKALGVTVVLNVELSIQGCQVKVPTTMWQMQSSLEIFDPIPCLSPIHFLSSTSHILMQLTWDLTIE